jgi:hypothetical protein
MLFPTSIDILRCCERTLETVIAPTLPSTGERSAAATIGHMLRHVVLRLEHEGQMLFDEIGMLRPLLAQVNTYLGGKSAGDAEATRVRAAVAAALAHPVKNEGYRSVANLADEVIALRQGACDALAYVQKQKLDPGSAAATIQEALNKYISWEVEQEAKIIDAAFEGHGPRR